jgi:hypothetical protein
MRNNKAILDEAARSVRRTFIGSVAGTVGMFAVIGAAGAYGMPENLTAQALSAAMSKFSFKFPREPVAPQPIRPVVVASNAPEIVVPAPKAPVVAAVPEAPVVQAPVVVAQNMPAPMAVSVVTKQAPAPAAAASVESRFDSPPPLREAAVPERPPVVPAIEPLPKLAPKPAESVSHTLPEAAAPAAPVVTASVSPRAIPDAAPPRSMISAPMVFEAAKATDAQVLTALPKTEEIVASAAPEPVQVQVQVPKSVMIALPLPKPPLTPAQRLELQGKDYDKAEKCLAQAVYFEARNEPARGQEAVAQVVLNRVFSPYYPKDVCSVVYQNAHHYLGCQFTFACDGKPEYVNERGPWARANRIAKQTLDAKIWLADVDKATHYHAAYVRPKWIRDMKVLARYGLHTFYRPRNWGDGSNEAHWGTAANSVKPATATATAAKPLTPAQKRFAYRRI